MGFQPGFGVVDQTAQSPLEALRSLVNDGSAVVVTYVFMERLSLLDCDAGFRV